jgi:hypothetical protein
MRAEVSAADRGWSSRGAVAPIPAVMRNLVLAIVVTAYGAASLLWRLFIADPQVGGGAYAAGMNFGTALSAVFLVAGSVALIRHFAART